MKVQLKISCITSWYKVCTMLNEFKEFLRWVWKHQIFFVIFCFIYIYYITKMGSLCKNRPIFYCIVYIILYIPVNILKVQNCISSYCTYLGIFLTMSIKLYPWPWGIRVLNLFTRIMHTVEWTIFLYINNHWGNVPGLSVLFSRFTILYKKN